VIPYAESTPSSIPSMLIATDSARNWSRRSRHHQRLAGGGHSTIAAPASERWTAATSGMVPPAASASSGVNAGESVRGTVTPSISSL
jgi:hypothetical protein